MTTKLAKKASLHKQYSTDQIKEMVMEAALNSFATNGFEGTSFRTIAKTLQINHQNIGHYFGSKESLWNAAIEKEIENAAYRVVKYTFSSDKREVREQFEAYVRQAVDWTSNHAALFRIFCKEGMRNNPRYKQSVLPYVLASNDRIHKIFEHAISAGVVKDIPVEELLFIYKGGLLYRSIVAHESQQITGKTLKDSETRKVHADALLEMLLIPEK